MSKTKKVNFADGYSSEIEPSEIAAQGVKGDQGIQGIQGPKGDQGIQGFTGPQGIQGEKGDAGTIAGVNAIFRESLDATKFAKISDYSFALFESYPQFKLGNPGTLPAGSARRPVWSPDGLYCVVPHNSNTPYLTIYKVVGDTFTKLSNPATLPSSWTSYPQTGMSFSKDGKYLIVGNSPLIVYKIDRTNDSFTALNNTTAFGSGNLPSGTIYGVAVSSNNYLTITDGTANSFWTYQINPTTDTFTRVANPANLFPDNQFNCGYSYDAKYLVVGGGNGNVFVYKFDPSLPVPFSKLTTPANFPAALGETADIGVISFSYNGKLLAITAGSNNYFYTVDPTTDTFTHITSPSVSPITYLRDVQFSADSIYMYLIGTSSGHAVKTYLIDYSTFTFTAQANPSTTVTSGAPFFGVGISPNSKFLVFTGDSSPYVYIYKSTLEPKLKKLIG